MLGSLQSILLPGYDLGSTGQGRQKSREMSYLSSGNQITVVTGCDSSIRMEGVLQNGMTLANRHECALLVAVIQRLR